MSKSHFLPKFLIYLSILLIHIGLVFVVYLLVKTLNTLNIRGIMSIILIYTVSMKLLLGAYDKFDPQIIAIPIDYLAPMKANIIESAIFILGITLILVGIFFILCLFFNFSWINIYFIIFMLFLLVFLIFIIYASITVQWNESQYLIIRILDIFFQKLEIPFLEITKKINGDNDKIYRTLTRMEDLGYISQIVQNSMKNVWKLNNSASDIIAELKQRTHTTPCYYYHIRLRPKIRRK